MMNFRTSALMLCAVSALSLAACSSSSKLDDSVPPPPVETLFGQAQQALKEGEYKKASELFEEVDRNYPYSEQATEAQLMSAYALYKDERYDEAIPTFDRFIELHPGNPTVDYAYHLKALSFYEQISDVQRDQQMTIEALRAFDTLIARFPDSPYARDAQYKKDLVLDHLAGKEMEIGRYYQDRNYLNAALNRFQNVIRGFQTTSHVPEALHRMVECYMTLGLRDEAVRAAAVLGANYPGSDWYARSYQLIDPEGRKKLDDERSFVRRTVDSIL